MVGGWYTHAKDVVQLIGGILVICAAIAAFFLWQTGGLKPHTQEVADNLTNQVDKIQKDVAEIKQTIGAMPHQYEFDDQRKHLQQLDQGVAEAKSGVSGLDGRVSALERAQQFRNPKN